MTKQDQDHGETGNSGCSEPSLLIDPEFKALLPIQTEDERKRLTAAIVKEGCTEPLVVWKWTWIVVDGMTRFEICQQLGVPFETREMEFANRREVARWIDDNQLRRRNLTDRQKAVIVGREYNKLARDKRGNFVQQSIDFDRAESEKIDDNPANSPNCQPVSPEKNTAKLLSQKHDISERTVYRGSLRAAVIDLVLGDAEAANELPQPDIEDAKTIADQTSSDDERVKVLVGELIRRYRARSTAAEPDCDIGAGAAKAERIEVTTEITDDADLPLFSNASRARQRTMQAAAPTIRSPLSKGKVESSPAM